MEVLKYGDPFLKKVANEVKVFDESLQKEVDEMYDTMIKENGIGLAATQVGIDKRVIVIDLNDGSGRLEFVNPVIMSKSDEEDFDSEGCLSIPGVYSRVCRPYQIFVEAYSVKGQKITIKAEGLLSRAIQHEIDHLNGVLFIEHIDDLEKKRFKSKLKKIKNKNKQHSIL